MVPLLYELISAISDNTLMASITTAADNSLEYFFHCFSEKIRLDIAMQRIHMKYQVLFSSKDKSKIKASA